MKSLIKIIKRKRDEDGNELKTPEGGLKTSADEKSVEQSTREMVGTVKSWIAEFQQRKRTQDHSGYSLLHPSVGAPAPASPNT